MTPTLYLNSANTIGNSEIKELGLDPDDPVFARVVELIAPIGNLDFANLVKEFELDMRSNMQTGHNKMLPSFLSTKPIECNYSGNRHIVIDLGGTHLRFGVVRLQQTIDTSSKRQFELELVYKFEYPEHIRNATAEKFFDWISRRFADFCDLQNIDYKSRLPDQKPENDGITRNENNEIVVSLIFSFPVLPKSAQKTLVLAVGKDFRMAAEIEGTYVETWIQSAFNRANIHAYVGTVVHDAIAAFLAINYDNADIECCFCIGTGINAVISYEKECADPILVVINTEIGQFGKTILSLTKWDEEIDAILQRHYFQVIEQQSSGYYLGEILRRILLEIMDENLLFNGGNSDIRQILGLPWTFETELMAMIDCDNSPDFAFAKKLINDYFKTKCSTRDVMVLILIIARIIERGTSVLAMLMIALLNLQHSIGRAKMHADCIKKGLKMRRGESLMTTGDSSRYSDPAVILDPSASGRVFKVGIVGTVYRQYPPFQQACLYSIEKLTKLCDLPYEIEVIAVDDEDKDSLRGAVLALYYGLH